MKTAREDGYDIRTIQVLVGHNDVNTTMIFRLRSGQVYAHVLNRGGSGVAARLTGYDRLRGSPHITCGGDSGI